MFANKVTVQTDAGLREAGTLTRCIWCQATLDEVEKRGDSWEHWPNPHQVVFLDGVRFHFAEAEAQAKGYMVRNQLVPERAGYTLHFDEPQSPLGPVINDLDVVPWGSRVIALPHANR